MQVEGAEAALQWAQQMRARTSECNKWRDLARDLVQQSEQAQLQRDEGASQAAALKRQLAEVTADQVTH